MLLNLNLKEKVATLPAAVQAFPKVNYKIDNACNS